MIDQIAITLGRNKLDTDWTHQKRMSFAELAAKLSRSPPGAKDGPCFTPAIFSGSKRNLNQSVQIDIAPLDSDCGHTLDEIRAAVENAGLEAIIHSTYSHMTTETQVSVSAFEKSGIDDVSAFLRETKSFLPRVVEGARILGKSRDGANFIVEHNPCPKFRVIIPLSEPWRARDFKSQAEANAAWREFVIAHASTLGLQADQSCTDTSRLFYFPRTRPNGPEFQFAHIHGEPCDFRAVLAAAQDEGLFSGGGAHAGYKEPPASWLRKWAATHADRFEVVAALKACSPSRLKRLNGVKQVITCPFEDEHTKAGGEGTFAVNASQLTDARLPQITSGFVLQCSHNACAGRDRLALLSGLLAQGSLTESDLTDPEFLSAGPGSAAGLGNWPKEPSQPLPLFPPLAEAEPYPVDALGATLARAATAIASKAQVPIAMAAQSVLAAASLAACAHADVMLPYGQARPLSLFFATVAASGDRKSTSDREALWAVRKREEFLRERHIEEMQDWKHAVAAWAAEKRKIEGDKKIGFQERKSRLVLLGDEPLKPLSAFLTTGDMTIEGLVKNWPDAHAALGLFTAEGGMFTAGHGMNDDNRLKTAAMLSELWDGLPVRRIRALDGVTILPGRRLAMHVMIQPDAAESFLSNPTLRDQGLLSRVLIARPESLAGSRLYQEPRPEDTAAIRAYGARVLSILEAELALVPGKRNELDPRVLPIASEAATIWRDFHDHVETQCGADSPLALVRDVAAKAAEHAARIAGVITIVEDLHAREIGRDAMEGAVRLAEWYVCEALRLQQAGRTDPKLLRAAKLLEWLQGQPGGMAGISAILTHGPNALRTKAAAEDALAILAAHGWTVEVSQRPRIIKAVGEVSRESLSEIQTPRSGRTRC